MLAGFPVVKFLLQPPVQADGQGVAVALYQFMEP